MKNKYNVWAKCRVSSVYSRWHITGNTVLKTVKEQAKKKARSGKAVAGLLVLLCF
jgi:hypothetical protein